MSMTSFMIDALTISAILGSVCLIMWLCHAPLRKKSSARFRAIMWWVVALWLCVPFKFTLPQSPIMVEIPRQGIEQAITMPSFTSNLQSNNFTPQIAPATPALIKNNTISIWQMALAIWALGAMIFLATRLIAYFLWRNTVLKKAESVTHEQMLTCTNNARLDTRFTFNTPILESCLAPCPMVVGLLKPCLLLPKNLPVDDDAKMMLIHEYTHLKRGDILCKALWVLATSVHWFNPLVWLGATCAWRDLELACDETALKNQPQSNFELYGKALLSGITQKYTIPYAAVFATRFGSGKATMKSRLAAIYDQKHKQRGMAVLSLALALTLLVSVLVGCNVTNNIDTPINESSSSVVSDFTVKSLKNILPELVDTELAVVSEYATSIASGVSSPLLNPTDGWFNTGTFTVMPVCTNISIASVLINEKTYAVMEMFVTDSGSTGFPLGRHSYIIDVQNPTNDIKQIVPLDVFMTNASQYMSVGDPIMSFRTLAGVYDEFSSPEALRQDPRLLSSILFNLYKYDGLDINTNGVTLEQIAAGGKKYFGLDNYIPPATFDNTPVRKTDSGNFILLGSSPDISATMGWRLASVQADTIVLERAVDDFGIAATDRVQYTINQNDDGTIQILSCENIK